VSGNNVFVVWNEYTNLFPPVIADIFLTRSTDSGATFESVQNLSNNSGHSGTPKMLASGTNLYLTWRDNTGTGSLFDVLFIRSTGSGATFSNVTNVSNSAGQSDEPQIAASEEGNVFLVWDDESPGNSDVFLARSKDRGEKPLIILQM
jgi:hypothetical protein